MTGIEKAPAGWHPDPFARFEHRYWDGRQWAEHVGSAGGQATDPPLPAAPGAPVVPAQSAPVQPLRQETAGLLTSPTLVIKPRAKLIEVNAEYDVFDHEGTSLGAVREVGKTVLGKVFSASGLGGDDTRHRLEALDADGLMVMSFTRPEKHFRSKMVVSAADGQELGRIAQKSSGLFSGRARFDILSGRQRLGSIHADDKDAWSFGLLDADGVEMARISRTWNGQLAEMFTKGDNYVVQIHRPLDMPLRALVVAAALALDLALRRGSD